MKTIGSIVNGFKPTDWNNERLAKSFTENGICREVFEKYAERCQSFQKKHTKIKVPGYSPGRKQYQSAVIKKLSQAILSKSKHPHLETALALYHDTVVKFLEDRHPRLQNLLLSVEIDSDLPKTRTEAFQIICKNAISYDVTDRDIKTFYEIWHFDEISDVDAFIKVNIGVEDVNVFRSRVRLLTDRVNSLSSAILKQKDEIQSINQVFEATVARGSSFEKRFNEFENTIIKKHSENINLEKSIGGLEEKVTSIQRKIENRNEQSENFEKKVIENLRKSIVAELDSSWKESLKAWKAKVQSELNELRIEVKESQIVSENNYSNIGTKIDDYSKVLADIQIEFSPESVFFDKNGVVPSNQVWGISDEWVFINALREMYEEETGSSLSVENSAIYHCILKSFPCVTFGDYRIPKIWIKLLNWSVYCLEMVVPPTWASVLDWKYGFTYLFSSAQNNPKILVLNDYDNALVSCYLTPILKQWRISEKYPRSKIICHPNASSESLPDASFLESSIYVDSTDAARNRDIVCKEQKRINTPRGVIGVDPRVFYSWQKPTEAIHLSKLVPIFEGIEKAIEVNIPKEIVTNSCRLYSNLVKFFDHDFAQQSAVYHNLVPWLTSRHGQSYADTSIDFLVSLSPKKMVY